ncbi:RidA family protein [Maribacter sp. MJ134]|uniref:RidA family protein n=1 Tax=Maribacter sp. MJ134 TaxID=2496865 RepID=UPI000F832A1C|nr:RidA family protein [Maribacter sp. MJ134]AZQ58700.1 RidA family protein [Maribacter sp. MJ134]
MKNIAKIYSGPIFIIILTILSNSIFGQENEGKQFKKQKIGGEANWTYSEAVKISDYSELLFISGQIPVINDNPVPDDIKEQCEIAWSNVETQLEKADMTAENLVKVTFFVSDRKYLNEISQLRKRKLLGVKPAMTIIITGIYNENWLLEIEGIAAK